MKRFITILFITGGLFFAHSMHAQTANPKAGTDTTTANKKNNAGKGDVKPGNGNDITIDESGAPKPKHKKSNGQRSAPKGSAKKEESGNAGSPSEIAIDESGTSRPKPRPAKANSGTSADPPHNDSTITNQVGRPQN